MLELVEFVLLRRTGVGIPNSMKHNNYVKHITSNYAEYNVMHSTAKSTWFGDEKGRVDSNSR